MQGWHILSWERSEDQLTPPPQEVVSTVSSLPEQPDISRFADKHQARPGQTTSTNKRVKFALEVNICVWLQSRTGLSLTKFLIFSWNVSRIIVMVHFISHLSGQPVPILFWQRKCEIFILKCILCSLSIRTVDKPTVTKTSLSLCNKTSFISTESSPFCKVGPVIMTDKFAGLISYQDGDRTDWLTDWLTDL